MNGGGEESPPPCAGHEGGVPSPPPIKGPPLTPSSSHLLMKDLSPPLVLFPHGLGLARYMFLVALSGKELLLPLLCWSEGWRLSGGLNVCASTDALLSCGARTSSRS